MSIANKQDNILHKSDQILDKSLRPSSWNEYVGQNDIKKNLQIILEAAKERNQPPEHILFYGPPGLGKTTLANLIATEIKKPLKYTSGPAIEKVGDLASILTNLNPGEILFIDEIHRLNKMVEEILYPAMEAGSLNIVVGKGPGARIIQLELPPFTLMAATTRMSLLSSPLRSRFSGGTFRLEFYNNKEIETIIKRSARIMNIDMDDRAAQEIASRSRFTPRVANQLLKRCRDYCQIKKSPINKCLACEALDLFGLDSLGLTSADRELLLTILEKFKGGPVGLSTLAASLAEEVATIEEVYEPYLMRLGLLERTPRGRKITDKLKEHLR